MVFINPVVDLRKPVILQLETDSRLSHACVVKDVTGESKQHGVVVLSVETFIEDWMNL